MDYEKLYVKPPMKAVPVEQLIQLLRIVSDGDLISKSDRDMLVDRDLAIRSEGYNIISLKGIKYLKRLGAIL